MVIYFTFLFTSYLESQNCYILYSVYIAYLHIPIANISPKYFKNICLHSDIHEWLYLNLMKEEKMKNETQKCIFDYTDKLNYDKDP